MQLASNIRQLGRVPHELNKMYGQEATYAVLAKVFAEHFRPEAEKVQVKSKPELSASSLHSPYDLEVGYFEKGCKEYCGTRRALRKRMKKTPPCS